LPVREGWSVGERSEGSERRATSGGYGSTHHASTARAASPSARAISKVHLGDPRAGARQGNATLRAEPSVSESLWLRSTPVRNKTAKVSRAARKTQHQSTKNEASRAAPRFRLIRRHGMCDTPVLPYVQTRKHVNTTVAAVSCLLRTGARLVRNRRQVPPMVASNLCAPSAK